MDRQLIKSLIDALAGSDMSELEYTADGATLRLVKERHGDAMAPPPGAAAARAEAPQPQSAAVSTVVASPSFGIVHLRRSAGAPPLVATGDKVVAGQALCLMEAMKVFTELRAEGDATIAEILVETGQEVEAGQALFRLG